MSSRPITREEIEPRLRRLESFLSRHEAYWTQKPFTEERPPWTRDQPDLAAALRTLDDETIDRFEADIGAEVDLPEPLPRLRHEASKLATVGSLTIEGPRMSDSWEVGILERKRPQIAGFVALVGSRLDSDSHLVDWCSGKGHLGRTLASATGRPVRFLERRTDLRPSALDAAAEAGIAAEFVPLDVLSLDPSPHVDGHSTLVALHACGDLSDRLLEIVESRRPAVVALASCCYGKSTETGPIYAAARRADLPIDRELLRIVAMDETVARESRRRRRRREAAFRLGFDQLIRQLSGDSEFVKQGAFPRSWADLSFAEFCKNASEKTGHPLPPGIDLDAHESEAWRRFHEARAHALPRHLFRRPLELWVTLVRAEALASSGYDVTVSTFCDREATPRNLAVVGVRLE